MVADLLDVDGLSEDAVLVLLLQLTEHGSQQDVEGGQLDLQHRLLLLHLTGEHTVEQLSVVSIHVNRSDIINSHRSVFINRTVCSYRASSEFVSLS